MKTHIQFGSTLIDFELVFSERKTLGITVRPDSSVIVAAPIGSQLDDISRKIRKKAPWILKQRNFFLTFEPRTPPRRFVSGETHLYAGRQYQLRIENAESDSVKLIGRYLEVKTTNKKYAEVLVRTWYAEKAQQKLTSIALPLIHRFRNNGVEPKALIFKEMPQRWGSCTARGKIILNPELVKAPKGCIEYVVIHELCHLVHHDHTKKFFDLQKREMPDWEKWKAKLEKILA
ncbi:MAG: M48 family metallopeptidase [Acidobacteria bacterium]|nr:M48 family metallopeptidase [Acidobacteriota bacterium]